MDISVQTGQTKTGGGIELASLSYVSPLKEHACLLLHIEGDVQDAKTLEEESIAVLKHSLLATEGEAWHRLDGTLKEFNGLFKGFLASRTVSDIHAVVCLLDAEGTLHISHAGRGEAYLLRGGSASQITEYVRGKPVSLFVHISSGALEPGDTVVLSTQRLLRTFTPAQLLHAALRRGDAVNAMADSLEREREVAALGLLHVAGVGSTALEDDEEEDARTPLRRSSAMATRLPGRKRNASILQSVQPLLSSGWHLLVSATGKTRGIASRRVPTLRRGASRMAPATQWLRSIPARIQVLLADLKHPERKRRAHFLLLAGAVGAFLCVWLVVQLSTTSQRSKTKAELEQLVESIGTKIRTAENKHLTGDSAAAVEALSSAEREAKDVINNDSGLFRMEALGLLDTIHAKKEELHNIIRISPRLIATISAKNPDVSAQGLIGIADGEFIAHDREQWYHVLLNAVDDGKRLSDEDLIIDGADFSRYKSQVFLTTGNSLIELIGNQPTTMKTEAPGGWATGTDIKTYLRYLYILSERGIMKYERLSNRYGAPVKYDVNANLTGAIDMTIDENIYVLKAGGEILSLRRGETQKFERNLPETDLLKDTTKIFKVADGNFYLLDPTRNRIIVLSEISSAGEMLYLKQYVLEGDTLGKLQDLYVDPDQSHVYVMDEKRLYAIDVTNK